MFPVFLDTCVLLKPYLCDLLLTLSEYELFQPLWSPDIMVELRRNLLKQGVSEKQVRHRLDQMNEFFPDATITEYEHLIKSMTNDAKDRHVLAAAVHAGAEVLVTENIRDFPERALVPYGLVAMHQDDFLVNQLNLSPIGVLRALHRQTSRYKREPRTTEDLLAILSRPGNGCHKFSTLCLALL